MAKQNRSIPLILILAIALFILLGLQLARMFISGDLASLLNRLFQQEAAEQTTTSAPTERTGDGFRDIAAWHPKRNADKPVIPGRPIQVTPQTYAHNIVAGSITTPLTLHIYVDWSCQPCRAQVNQVLAGMPRDDMQVVYKFMPATNNEINGGIFTQLAHRHDLWPALRQQLNQSGQNLDAASWSALLEEIGVPLKQQRAWLAEETNTITRNLERDIQEATRFNLVRNPAFVLNNYLIDGTIMLIQHLPRYAVRLRDGKDLLNASDYARLNNQR